mgnify:CR=1 FL=1
MFVTYTATMKKASVFNLVCLVALVLLSRTAWLVGAANVRSERGATDGDEASDDFRGKLWRPDLSAHEIATESEGEQFYKNLKNKCETLRKKTADARKASGEICNVEIKETKAYVSSGEKFGEANTKQKKEAQQALLEAVNERIATLEGSKTGLAVLKKSKANLHELTKLVNALFKSKFLENAVYLQGATTLLHQISNITRLFYNPHLHPIRGFEEPVSSFVEIPFEENQLSASLLELTNRISTRSERAERVRQRVATLKTFLFGQGREEIACANELSKCHRARKETFDLYVVSMKLNTLMFKNFQKEREVLIDFHKWINAAIHRLEKSRSGALAGLKKQRDRVLRAIARDETFDGHRLQEHLKILDRVCPAHNVNAKKEAQLVDELCKIINEKHSPPKKKYSSPATGATGTSAK